MEKNNYLHDLRHSAAHLVAHAVMELYPDTLLTIGPVTETGFFYDFLPAKNFKEEDLPLIEARMHEIAARGYTITGQQMPKAEARQLYEHNKFKRELIDQIEGDTVGIYTQGNFYDLCRGGHVDEVKAVKHFKLMHISGAYWRADRSGQALQRITGICFETKEALDAHLKLLEDLQAYDHRRLGKQLDLFSFRDIAPGIPFFHHKGLVVYNKLIEFLRYLRGNTYQEIKTPLILNESLWRTSGHYDNYRENMYFTSAEDVSFCVKPMNCPGSILHYQERPHSYRELPIRLAEFGLVHRFELSGALHGLFRVRAFTQDDAHLYCMIDQIEQEVGGLMDLVEKLYAKFGFTEVKRFLSLRPEKSMGSDEGWNSAIGALKNVLDKRGIAYEIDKEGGAFYGPKIDMKIVDAMGREWQCGTIQVDFTQPENFKLEYIDKDQSRKRPVMIHVALYGSIERFLGILLEHTKGHLPFWIAPLQVRVLTITDAQNPYGQEVVDAFANAGIRVELDESGDQISAKIRRAQTEKIPWMVVIGKKEVDNNTITLRYNDGKQEFGLKLAPTIQQAVKEAAF
jgi:threonyl-tRNA synthetase